MTLQKIYSKNITAFVVSHISPNQQFSTLPFNKGQNPKKPVQSTMIHINVYVKSVFLLEPHQVVEESFKKDVLYKYYSTQYH